MLYGKNKPELEIYIMNFRTSVKDGITPLETALVDLFSLKMARSTTRRALSGKYILHYIYFYNYNDLPNAYSNTEEWLRHSIFTDDYIGDRLLSDNSINDTELLYYVMHLEAPLPKNLAPKLSNLIKKSDSTTGQPPEVRSMILHIDPDKLSRHFERFYERQLEWNAKLPEQLSGYVQSILEADARINGVCQEYCSQIFEQLAWITVYSLADNDCFDQYENAYRIMLQQRNRVQEPPQPDTASDRADAVPSDADVQKLKNRIAEEYRKVSFYS